MGRIWMERLLRWQMKLRKMMTGRYGQFDSLNRLLLGISVGLMVINIFVTSTILRVVSLALIILIYYRFFSKKIYPRANENTKFLRMKQQIIRQINKVKMMFLDRKAYRFFSCPNCKQALRAPKGKGKIKVTCNKCQHQFMKKV